MAKETLKSIMIGILTLVLVITLFFTFRISSESQKQVDKIANLETTYSPAYLQMNSLTVSTFEERVANGDKVIVYIGRPSCPDCGFTDTFLSKYVDEYQLGDKLYYVNVEKKRNEGKDIWQAFKDKYSFEGTPTYAVYKDGQVVTKLDYEALGGFQPIELEAWLVENVK